MRPAMNRATDGRTPAGNPMREAVETGHWQVVRAPEHGNAACNCGWHCDDDHELTGAGISDAACCFLNHLDRLRKARQLSLI